MATLWSFVVPGLLTKGWHIANEYKFNIPAGKEISNSFCAITWYLHNICLFGFLFIFLCIQRKTMCPPGYHQISFMTTIALGTQEVRLELGTQKVVNYVFLCINNDICSQIKVCLVSHSILSSAILSLIGILILVFTLLTVVYQTEIQNVPSFYFNLTHVLVSWRY